MTSSWKKRCLLVEDEMQVAELVKSALEKVGIDPAAPLHGATQQSSSDDIDVALDDLAFDDMALADDALDDIALDDIALDCVAPAVERLRECGVPFLFHTGRNRQAPRPVAAKPLDESSLLASLLSYVITLEPCIGAKVSPTIH